MIQKPKTIVFKYALFLLVTLILVLSGCAQKVQLQVIKPAEINTKGIQKVAIGRFELGRVNHVYRLERNGKWVKDIIPLTEKERQNLANQIRGRVTSLLSRTPYFSLVYTDEFAALDNDTALQNAIAAGGFKTSEVDAVINGKIWLEVIKTDGVELDKSELAYQQGGRQGGFNYEVEILAYWPYKSITGTLALEMKMTRLNPTEVIAITFDSRRYSHKVGGKPATIAEQIAGGAETITSTLTKNQTKKADPNRLEESDLVLPNFDQIVADLSESIAAQFVRRVAITQKLQDYQIAGGGDQTAQMLIEAGAFEKAIGTLNNALAKAEEKSADDYYNLGLCFEATGDFGLAAVSYEDAVKIDPTNLLYAQGVGRIDRLKRENHRLKEQLKNKP